MRRTIEAIIEDDGTVRLLEPIEPGKARRALVTILDEDADDSLHETALLSERALGDWEREEEDEAWHHLQSEK